MKAYLKKGRKPVENEKVENEERAGKEGREQKGTNVDDKKTKLNKKYFGITTIYWSKTNGLIRFDDDNSESWEIVKE